jgi:hypothetical protein
MRRLFSILIAAAALIAAGLFARSLLRGGADLPPVPPGDQEVAWIHAATSGASWERFVAGVHRTRHDWPRLYVDDSRAFLDQTTAVPEVVLGVDGAEGRLHVRWYKLTSATDSNYWVKRLATRDQPPLAFIGGGTSDRAEALARALAAETSWHGPRPLLLITTATANGVAPDVGADAGPGSLGQTALMSLYPGRSFRFCFTNEQMAEAVVDFLWSQPHLRPNGDPVPALAAVPLAAASPTGAAALLAARAEIHPPRAYALYWEDDPYSSDLASQFHKAFHQPQLPPVIMGEQRGIPYSVGDFYRPNEWEALAADRLLAELQAAPLERRALVLPAGATPARRVLRAMCGAMPLVGRNVVAISGDSISLNNVYRDADITWNIRAIPVPLVFFAHQNPVAWDPQPGPTLAAAAGSPTRATSDDPGVLLPPTSTDDVLLHRDLVRLLVESAYGTDDGAPALVDSADILAERLRNRKPAFFDAAGDRRGGRGEYVAVLLPKISDAGGGTQVRSSADLEVWTREEAGRLLPAARWKLIKRLVIDHARRPDTAP